MADREIRVPKPVRYCYECGKRVDASRESCWYCGVPIRRGARPPQACPFCGSEIPHGALKCKHCGEWIDGRPRPAEVPRQVVFVVDRTLLGSMADMQLLAGQPVPAEIASRLPPRTIEAIERNDPRLIEGPGVRALPAPEAPPAGSGEIIDVHPIERAPAVRGEGSNLPAPRPASAPARAFQAITRRKPTALARPSAEPPARRPPPPPAVASADIDAEADPRYRICEQCGEEIQTSDNYCYHCGAQYHRSALEIRQARARAASRSSAFIWVAMVLIIATVGVRLLPIADRSLIATGVALCAALSAAVATARAPGLVGRLAGGVLLLGAVAARLWPL